MKRQAVYAPEGYHPVKVARSDESHREGEHIKLPNYGTACAIDNVDGDDFASFQTRGLVSLLIKATDLAKHGALLYATYKENNRDEISISAALPDVDLLRPWGIILQKSKRSGDQVMVRAYKFPGPNTLSRRNDDEDDE